MADILKSERKGAPLKAFVDINWGSDVAKFLIDATRRMGDAEPLLRTIGRKVVHSVQRNFMEQRSPEGERWAGLKRPRGHGHNPGRTVLFDSGTLYEDIHYSVQDKQEVAIGFGSAAFYGKFHQDGTGTIPQRRFLGFRDGDLPDLGVREYLESSFMEAASAARS